MGLRTERVTPAIGAEVTGLDLTPTFDSDQAETLYEALMEHQILVLRNIMISPGELAALASVFGPLAGSHHSYKTHPDCPDTVVLDWNETQRPDSAEWHSDLTFRKQPPFASFLHGIIVPPCGGDTLWASIEMARAPAASTRL